VNHYFPPTYRLGLTAGEHSARHVRRIVRSLLDEWRRSELCDAVELGVTELLSNVVRHVPDRRCTLVIVRQATGVRVEVTDGLARHPSLDGELEPYAENGRGLLLLDAMADKWGVTPAAGVGKTVWFECWC
jgi:anti-sigma regulatory factor (Ser/Thr protein kinase)